MFPLLFLQTSFITGGASSAAKHDNTSSHTTHTPHNTHVAHTSHSHSHHTHTHTAGSSEASALIVAKDGQTDHFDMAYDVKSDIPRAVFGINNKSDAGKEVDETHESSKLNHYSKLGSAFANNNALLRAGPAGGRGRGRGRGIQ